MEIRNYEVAELLRRRVSAVRAAAAEEELPARMDTSRDARLLREWGLDPDELVDLLYERVSHDEDDRLADA